MRSCDRFQNTLEEVAKRASVSVATVSRVIRNIGAVRPETREKVLKVLEELQYVPNVVARSLRTSQSFIVGVIIPNILNPFFAKIVRGIEEVLDQHDYVPIIFDTREDPEKENKCLQKAFERRVDGLIFGPSVKEGRSRLLYRGCVPVVFVDRYLDISKHSKNFDIVRGNNYSGVFQAISYLASQGYREIGGIMGPRNTVPGEERYNAFIDALRAHGLRVVEEYIKEGDFSVNSGYQRAQDLLQLGRLPEAILVTNNLMGIGALRAFREAGLKVPQDLGLVVFDETYVADLTDPPLTVIMQPAEEIGRVAARCLLERIQKGDLISPREIFLDLVLVVRDSAKRGLRG